MKKKARRDISVIIPAAGRGKRMGIQPACLCDGRQACLSSGRQVSKPFIKIKGIPILFHTLNKFKNISPIREIIIALGPQDLIQAKRLFKRIKISCELKLVRGGLRRQDSVFNALKAVAPESRYVIIHDAARPLVKKSDILRLIKETRKSGACILAIPITDTIKRVNPITKKVKYTLRPRQEFWSVQTPQGFRKDILIAAYKKALPAPLARQAGRKQRLNATDDASLVEAQGYPIKIIPGRYENIKITTPIDKIFCEALLKI